jgi:N-acetyl-gamma-glutamyl-phosphate/LysW-gamma-L-alpha-aminoadipyl-6-phosphate reductase
VAETITASIVGGSGYVGGETLRLLLQHPHVRMGQVTSESNAGKFVYAVHPNLRKQTDLKFTSLSELAPCDVLFLCLPHGMSMGRIGQFTALAPRIIDLSADFRLRDAQDYPRWYGHAHEAPEMLKQFVYGIPELHRAEIKASNYATGAGCLATATILGLYPLFKKGLVEPTVFIEGKVGSSAAGNEPGLSSHHPERAGAVRSFQPTGHRHTGEIIQELTFGDVKPVVHFSATSVELVRGILATAHVMLKDDLAEKDLWQAYREVYGAEPFMRIVKDRSGVYRYPEPKILAGSNFCDVGFERDAQSRRVVVMSAIDNLMKGAAGNGVQAMNVMLGLPETTALTFPGLHPV